MKGQERGWILKGLGKAAGMARAVWPKVGIWDSVTP